MLSLQKRNGDHQKHPPHRCPIDGCTEQLPRDTLLCRDHWYLCPLELRRQVVAAWRMANRGTKTWLEYLEVRQAAIDAVQRQVGGQTAEGQVPS